MSKWSANFVNDPNNDYELLIELLYEEEDVAIIKRGKMGLELTWYSTTRNLTVPCDWLIELINNLEQAHNDIINKKSEK